MEMHSAAYSCSSSTRYQELARNRGMEEGSTARYSIYRTAEPRRDMQGRYQEGTARPDQLSCKRCSVKLEASAACKRSITKGN